MARSKKTHRNADDELRNAERKHEETGSDATASRLEAERARRGDARFWLLVDALADDHDGRPGLPAKVRVHSGQRGYEGAYHDTRVWAQPVSLTQSVFSILAEARALGVWHEAWLLDARTGEVLGLNGAARAFVSLEPGVTPLRQGVWTPWAEVLCIECHNESPRSQEPGRRPFPAVSLIGPGPDEAITTCQKCGSQIALRHDVALLRDLVVAVQTRFAGDSRVKGAVMEQTGGMNSAASVELADGRHVIFVDDEESNEPEALWAGLYASGAWEEGEAAEDGKAVRGVDAAIGFVEETLSSTT